MFKYEFDCKHNPPSSNDNTILSHFLDPSHIEITYLVNYPESFEQCGPLKPKSFLHFERCLPQLQINQQKL